MADHDDWLHDKEPLRVVGNIISGGLAFVIVYRWQLAERWRKVEMLRRFESIKWMNDRNFATRFRPSNASPMPPTRKRPNQ